MLKFNGNGRVACLGSPEVSCDFLQGCLQLVPLLGLEGQLAGDLGVVLLRRAMLFAEISSLFGQGVDLG